MGVFCFGPIYLEMCYYITMSKFDKKIKAISLRKRGESVKDIAIKLSLSKSTVSIWCRDIVLTAKQYKNLKNKMVKAGHAGRIKGANVNKQKRIDAVSEGLISGKKRVGEFASRDLLIAGIALYWAEGSKKDNKFAFSNSDPRMIILMCRWLEEFFSLKKEDLMPRIFINESHKYRLDKVLTFWSSLLKLPSVQFGKPTLLKINSRKVYSNKDSYFGVLSLRVRKSSQLKYDILGMIEQIK